MVKHSLGAIQNTLIVYVDDLRRERAKLNLVEDIKG